MADVALELETTKLQFNKAKKDIAAAGEKGADTSAISADLAKVKAELEKAKKQAVSVAAKGGEALMKLKEMHKLEIAEANRGSAKLQQQLALSKAATNDMAKGKAAEAAKAAAQMQECTARQENDAREEGRKAGLQACPGVNGLMREIWRLRQKLGKAAAGEEEEQ